ncbi:uncharacterized protein LOC125494741 [Beta vulgaris subsp. vulgaris]|uniref:uncharacterized protein LOC125494741 n=1 Tax=Beta vulgaris subsp. vulgaris TaxID=3555 RepID=UPI0020369764|nr:uncharacterized protein LOC125494741 [Beta vulgaris subsp. vulgaris]
MGLKFVAPSIVNGDRIAKLDKVEIEKQSECWMNALVVYVVGQNPTLNSITQYINAHWVCSDEPVIFKHDEGFFIVRHKSREERDKVLYTRPHLFYGKPIIIKHWSANFNFHDEILKVVPIWTKFPNLPLSCWGEDSLSRIASLLGVPLYDDECTSKGLRVSYDRVLIEIDVTQEIPREVAVEDPNGKRFQQKVLFDWLPPFCKKCQMVGHNCNKATMVGPKITQKWVPKREEAGPVAGGDVEGMEITSGHLENEVITPVATPAGFQGQVDEDGGAWKIVTRKTKDKGKGIQS